MADNKDKITENKKDFLFEDIRKIKALITSVFKLKCKTWLLHNWKDARKLTS